MAALVGVIAVFVIAHPARAKGVPSINHRVTAKVVAMTDVSLSEHIKPIRIEDSAPYINVPVALFNAHPLRHGDVAVNRLAHLSAGHDDVISGIFSKIDAGYIRFEITFDRKLHFQKPMSIAGWQMASVFESDKSYTSFIQTGRDASRFAAQIGPLKDSGVVKLSLGGSFGIFGEFLSGSEKAIGRITQSESKPSNESSENSGKKNPIEIKFINGSHGKGEENIVTFAILVAAGWVTYLAFKWVAK